MSRSPFMPVRKRDGDGVAGGQASILSSDYCYMDGMTSNPGLGIGRPSSMSSSSTAAVQPLTSSALANWTASAANIQASSSSHDYGHGHSRRPLNAKASAHLSTNDRHAPPSPTTSTTTSTLLGQGKRYTRQLAPAATSDDQDAVRSPALSNMASASDLRAKARITSGSAPRRKPTVPGTEYADRGTSSHYSRDARLPQTPSATRAVSNGAAIFSASAASTSRHRSRSISRTASPVPSVPSSINRPASRAGHAFDHAPSRPASRMDDYGPDCIIRATPSSDDDSDDCDTVSDMPRTPGNALHIASRRTSFAASIMSPQSRQENVLVCVRVRPPIVGMISRANSAAVEEAWIADSSTGSVRLADNLARSNDFHFDAVVTGSGNETVYGEAAKDLVGSAMQGYDAVIFAYGQTASGKTFTLSGNAQNPGIIPQAVRDIFAYIRAHPQKEFLLRASYIEIYNEQLKDLLAPETVGQVKIRQDDKRRFFVSPLREEVVTNELHVVQLLERGEVNRHTGQTDYNAHSSRSHTVFQIVIESRDVGGAAPIRSQTPGFSRLGKNDDRAVTSSRLSLIDLAGSEKATSQADRRVEGAFINKSLLTLEKVIAALTEKKAPAHIPYRDSKLTQILQPSLSGEARVSVICTINPSPLAVQESTTTLKFAQRVKKVTLHAEKNEIVGDKALLIRYEQTIAEMTAYIAQLESANGTTSAPSTPRQLRAGGEETKHNPEVRKAKEDMAKLQGYIVNAQNIDDARDVAPRPITPVKPARSVDLPFLQEQLLDAQDRIGELEEVQERQLDEIAALKAELASRPSSTDSSDGNSSGALNILRKRNEELEKQCREFRVILANEDTATALKSERRLAAREWSDKLLQLQNSLDRSKQLQQDALAQLAEERGKTARLERALLKRGNAADSTLLAVGQPPKTRRRSGSLDGLPSLSHESPMLSTTVSYMNLDEIAHSPTATPTRLRNT